MSDIKFSDITVFLEWLQPTIGALQAGEELPPPPRGGGGDIDEWTQTIHALVADRWESESLQAVMKAEIGERENELAVAGQQLAAALEQARAARAERDELQQEAAGYRQALGRLGDLVRQIDDGEREAKGLGAEFAKKAAQLDTLAGRFRDAAAVLQNVLRSLPGERARTR